MALAFSTLTANHETATDGVAVTASVSPSSGAVLYVAIVLTVASGAINDTSDGGDHSISLSGLSGTWTKVHVQQYSSRRLLYVFRGTNAGSWGSGAITITASAGTGSAVQDLAWIVDEVTGADTTTPNDAAIRDQSSDSLTLGDVGTVDSGDAVYVAGGHEAAANNFQCTGYTGLGDFTSSGNVRHMRTWYDDSTPDETPNFTSNGGGNGIGGIAFVVNVGAASGQSVTPNGVASAASYGSQTVANVAAQTVAPTGIASAASYGSHTVVRTSIVTPTGVASAAAYGAQTVANATPQGISPNGVASAVEYGAHTLSETIIVTPTGVATAVEYGAQTVANAAPQSVTPNGVASAASYGSQTVANAAPQEVTPSGIASAASYGAHTLTTSSLNEIVPSGIASAAQYGSHTVADVLLEISPNGVSSQAAYGAQTVANVAAQGITPAGIASAAQYGSHTVADVLLAISPNGIASAAEYGMHMVSGGVFVPSQSRGGLHVGRAGIWIEPR